MSDEAKVVVDRHIWSKEDEHGGRRQLAGPGDVISIDRAKELGIDPGEFEVTHVVAPYPIWSEVDEHGGSTQLYYTGDPVPVDEAKALGIDVADAKPAKRKRKTETTRGPSGPPETTTPAGPPETTAIPAPEEHATLSTASAVTPA